MMHSMKTIWTTVTGSPIRQPAKRARVGCLRVLRDAATGRKIGQCRLIDSEGKRRWRAATPDLHVPGHYGTIHSARDALIRAFEQNSIYTWGDG